MTEDAAGWEVAQDEIEESIEKLRENLKGIENQIISNDKEIFVLQEGMQTNFGANIAIWNCSSCKILTKTRRTKLRLFLLFVGHCAEAVIF